MFTRNPQEARAVVESLLEGPLRFEATGPGGTGGGNGGRGSRFVITGSANPVGLIRLAPTEFRTDQTPLGTCSVLNLIRSIARTARRECANPRD
jgi:hypothetical protein